MTLIDLNEDPDKWLDILTEPPRWQSVYVPPPPPPSLRELLNSPCPDIWDGEHTIKLYCIINRANRRMISAQCRHCGVRTPHTKYADLEELLGVKAHEVPASQDNRCPYCESDGCPECCPTPCARCRKHIPTDRHHMAPTALFVDANLWPIIDLCRQCHQYWHRVVTPGIRHNPQPVAPHLAREWTDYHNAKEQLRGLEHDYFCECAICEPHRTVIARWQERYGYW